MPGDYNASPSVMDQVAGQVPIVGFAQRMLRRKREPEPGQIPMQNDPLADPNSPAPPALASRTPPMAPTSAQPQQPRGGFIRKLLAGMMGGG